MKRYNPIDTLTAYNVAAYSLCRGINVYYCTIRVYGFWGCLVFYLIRV